MRKSRKSKMRRIDHYAKKGKKLAPPLASYPSVSPVEYHTSILPNLLWIEAVRDYYGDKRFVGVIHAFLDLFDRINDTILDPVCGLVQSFDHVPVPSRIGFRNANATPISDAVIRPFGSALRIYPRCPMAWLASHYSGEFPTSDLDSTLSALKRWTRSLGDRGGPESNMARAIILARYLKAGKLKLPPDKELIDELVIYPNCKDRRQTESMIRAMTNTIWSADIQTSAWAQDFWENNGKISMCTVNDEDKGATACKQDDWLKELSAAYAKGASEFLEAVKRDYLKYCPDTGNWEKTSTIAGLVSRTVALLLDILTENALWVGEIGGILLRCMCETLILSGWLIAKDDGALYKRFVLYSLGQADLYGLKIDGYEGYRDIFKALYLGDDSDADNLAKDEWAAQLRTIDLGNRAGVDTRKMAEEAGTKQYYDLIFTQCSSDVHSQFMSLAKWNLTACSNPLHNCHLLPAFGERRVNPFLPLTASMLAKETCDRIFNYVHVDAECTKVLAQLVSRIAAELLEKEHAVDTDPSEED